MHFRVVIRYGRPRQIYHTLEIEAPTLAAALQEAAVLIPSEVGPSADLAEIRVVVDPNARPYLDEPAG